VQQTLADRPQGHFAGHVTANRGVPGTAKFFAVQKISVFID
jgi:hypothetical protein